MDFNKKFQTYSTTELLKIIENAADYQPQAVEAAKTILAHRQLSGAELETAKSELETERQQKANAQQQKRETENRVKNTSKALFQQINPMQKGLPTSERVIRGVSIFLGVLFLVHLHRQFNLLRLVFTGSFVDWIDVVLYLSPFLIILAVAVLFFMRKKVGWLLAAAFFTYSAISAVVMSVFAATWQPSGIEALDALFSPNPIMSYVFAFLLFASVVWAISRENVREVYLISKKTAILSIFVVAFLTGGVVVFLSFW